MVRGLTRFGCALGLSVVLLCEFEFSIRSVLYGTSIIDAG